MDTVLLFDNLRPIGQTDYSRNNPNTVK